VVWENNKGIPPGAWTKCIDPCQLLDIAKTSRLPVPQNSPIGRRVLSMIMLDRKSYIGKEGKKAAFKVLVRIFIGTCFAIVSSSYNIVELIVSIYIYSFYRPFCFMYLLIIYTKSTL